MSKFVLYIDYFANSTNKPPCGYEYRTMNAKNLYDAISEADAVLRNQQDEIYLVRIMEGITNVKREGAYKTDEFLACLCNRGSGWHRNLLTYGEGYHLAKRYRTDDIEYFEFIG